MLSRSTKRSTASQRYRRSSTAIAAAPVRRRRRAGGPVTRACTPGPGQDGLRVAGRHSLGRPARALGACRPSAATLLGLGGVEVDVLLAGELHDLVHDLVGDRPQDVAVVLHALVAGEVQRLAEAHAGPGEGAELLARAAPPRRCRAPPPGSPARRSRGPAGRRRSCRGRAGRRGSGCPRGRSRTARPRSRIVRADDSAPSAAEAPGPVDRHLAGAGEELLLEPALDARGGEVLRLRHERDPARAGSAA